SETHAAWAGSASAVLSRSTGALLDTQLCTLSFWLFVPSVTASSAVLTYGAPGSSFSGCAIILLASGYMLYSPNRLATTASSQAVVSLAIAARVSPGQLEALRQAVERVLGGNGEDALPEKLLPGARHFKLLHAPQATAKAAGCFPLYEACEYLLAANLSSSAAREILGASGAEVGQADERGGTALMLASWNGQADGVEATCY
ncbi:hypothetical protein T492DRAFT_858741, partial [Pavlovales sp. CCMP2436]